MAKYLKLSLMYNDKNQGTFCQPIDDPSWTDIINDAEITVPGEFFKIEILEMTGEEYNNLPEFMGF